MSEYKNEYRFFKWGVDLPLFVVLTDSDLRPEVTDALELAAAEQAQVGVEYVFWTATVTIED